MSIAGYGLDDALGVPAAVDQQVAGKPWAPANSM